MLKTVMIVDDSASLRQVVSITLKGAGYSVIESVDGQDALERLVGQRVHLIVSDVNMPNLDGLGFVRAAKQRPEYRFVPVIMLTTEFTEEKKEEGRAAGAKAWIVKPFKPDLLLRAVQKLCPL